MTREDIFIAEHRSNILPLRWLANYITHPVSMFFFKIALRANDNMIYGGDNRIHNRFAESVCWNLYRVLDKPYRIWGTYYKFESDIAKAIAEDLKSDRWNDYDENGIPYWEKTGMIDPDEYNRRDGEIHPEIQKDLK